MKKEDVENVIIKAYSYWKSLLCNEVDLGELKELSEWIWDEISEEQELNAEMKRRYVVTKRQLSRLVTKGEYEFRDIYGNAVVLLFEDSQGLPSILESGTILVWEEDGVENQQKVDEFPDGKKNNEPEVSDLQKQMAELLKKKEK